MHIGEVQTSEVRQRPERAGSEQRHYTSFTNGFLLILVHLYSDYIILAHRTIGPSLCLPSSDANVRRRLQHSLKHRLDSVWKLDFQRPAINFSILPVRSYTRSTRH